MRPSQLTSGIAAGRLDKDTLAENFSDLHAPFTAHEAAVEADRCYFCYDAPCMTACPTSIDIPMFIRQISAGMPEAAAKTIFDQNILGGMCARVCPTETLCEEVCVRETAEGEPVEIGRLQRFATDVAMATPQPYARAASTGKTVGVVGAGPAGLACAHRLAMHGHDVVIYDARPKGGGLNEYGIAAYKTVDGFAQAEVDWLMGIGGITLEAGTGLGAELSLDDLATKHDAVFLGLGLGGVRKLGLGLGATSAVDFIADLRQAADLTSLEVGRNVVVVGGGMTAVDAAVQSKLLGAENVTIVYRRGKDAMAASGFEQDLAAQKGVSIRHWAQPTGSTPDGMEFEYTTQGDNGLEGTGETFTLPADQVLAAIGQTLNPLDSLDHADGKITVKPGGATSRKAVWAGGDCASGGDDLTVTAVAEGRDAAEDIHNSLMEG
ncbi:MAG: NAD(P)-dependent oxidoreductase [Paracoccaceae bacterium]|nr:NAD(P)-dependent oxidoreductase [Paracoccaceae bacterium]MDG1373130.1 NAD(P)-dependent oxidoreductase [Paracoccaceae bacterium]